MMIGGIALLLVHEAFYLWLRRRPVDLIKPPFDLPTMPAQSPKNGPSLIVLMIFPILTVVVATINWFVP